MNHLSAIKYVNKLLIFMRGTGANGGGFKFAIQIRFNFFCIFFLRFKF